MAFIQKSLLSIYINENSKIDSNSLYEFILHKAVENGIDGGSVFRGIMSYGKGHKIHSAKLLQLSMDLPVKIELVDYRDKLIKFYELINANLVTRNLSALFSITDIDVLTNG